VTTKAEVLGELRLGQADLAHLADHKADARAHALHVAWDIAQKAGEYLVAWCRGHAHRDKILERDARQQPTGTADLHPIRIREDPHGLATPAVVAMHHRLPQRLVGIFGFILTIKPTNGRTDLEALPLGEEVQSFKPTASRIPSKNPVM
jgi:hypothetical protein